MPYDITPATEQDAHDLSLLTGALLEEIMEKIGSRVFDFDPMATKTRAAELVGRGVYFAFIARERENGEAVGFLSLYESYALYTEGAFGTIPELYVRPRYRSQGIGELLLQHARAFALSRGWKRLEVTTPPLPQFERTLAFYESNGFEISGGRKLKSAVRSN